MKARAAKASALDRLLQLPGLKKSGKDQYLAQCPAHDDSNASLSFNVDAKGVVGVTCHVGCKAPAICKALGLSLKDLFPNAVPAQKAVRPKAKPARVAMVKALSAAELEEARQAAKTLGPSKFETFKLTSVYPYRLATGKVWSYRARFDNKSGDKQIFPFHLTGEGWVKSEPSAPRAGKPLYRLPEVLATTGPVFVVEGEKCADALAFLGLAATTSGAAKSASKADWTPLAGRDCIIWPDNDDPGDAYAADVAERLLELSGNVAVINVEALDLANAHDDAADWLAANPGASAADVLALATIAPRGAEPEVTLIRASDVEAKPVDWLWDGWLARSMLHILAGDGGTGKTTLALSIVAAVSTGGLLPDGSRAPLGNVIFWTGEDALSEVLVPRLQEVGADMDRVLFVGHVGTGKERRAFDPATDVHELEREAKKVGNVALVVVDPIASAIAGDSHKNTEVRRGLQPLVDLGESLRAAVLGITHFSKNSSGRKATERIIGSVAFAAVARVTMVTAMGEDNACRLVRSKSNIGPQGDGFEYEIRTEDRDFGKGKFAKVSKVVWGTALSGRADALLGQLEGKRTARDEAADWLYSMLSAGPVSSKDLKAKAADDGIAWRTVERAKNELRVDAKRLQEKGKGRGEGEWIWTLPATGREAAEVGRRQTKYSA